MQIHRIRGRDLNDALERAGRLHGTDALVLGHEQAPGGGVVVAVGSGRKGSAPPERPGSREKGLTDVERFLVRSGCSEQLVKDTLEAVEGSRSTGAFAIDAAASHLGGLVPIAPSPRVARRSSDDDPAHAPHLISFVGPTGVGKTTTLAKLAARLVRARRRVALVTLDQRPTAIDALKRFGTLLQAPVDAARDGLELARITTRSRHVDAVLVDTSGSSPRDGDALQLLGRVLERAVGGARSHLDVYLTVPATSSRTALDETRIGFRPAGLTGLVITKLDETAAPAPVLEFARESELPVALLADGQDRSRHLHRPRPDHFADLFLRGRIA